MRPTWATNSFGWAGGGGGTGVSPSGVFAVVMWYPSGGRPAGSEHRQAIRRPASYLNSSAGRTPGFHSSFFLNRKGVGLKSPTSSTSDLSAIFSSSPAAQ